MDLHRFEFFCEDRNVARITRAISGLALPQGFKLQPVVNVEQKGERFVAASGGTSIDILATWIKENQPTRVTIGMARKVLTEAGFAPTSTSKTLHRAEQVGILRKAKGRGGYLVVRHNPDNNTNTKE